MMSLQFYFRRYRAVLTNAWRRFRPCVAFERGCSVVKLLISIVTLLHHVKL